MTDRVAVQDAVRAAAARARAAFVGACRLDVAVPKPGNVSVGAPGHRMEAAQFIASADAAAPFVGRCGARVGERIEAAVTASWAAVGCNTNLGIVLLCAPLAAAAERMAAQAESSAAPAAGAMPTHRLRAVLRDVLADLDVADAAAAFRAIAAANPGGLGRLDEHDVRAAPQLDLRAAMAVAAPRDRIAQQYIDGYAAVFEVGVPALRTTPDIVAALAGRSNDAGAEPTAALRQAVQRCFLTLLATFPDSHILRKHGDAAAQTVMQRAACLQRDRTDVGATALLDWDVELKRAGINPGSTADLTVATLMAVSLSGR